jgi:predicted CoA-binding protein
LRKFLSRLVLSTASGNNATMSEQEQINTFLAGKRFAVVGASANREKYGNKVLRVYQQNELNVVPVNPAGGEIEGLKAYTDLPSVRGPINSVSIITPPEVTEQVVAEAVSSGIKNIWMQPGAESPAAIATAQEAGANVIAGGPCILVSLGFHE